MISREMTLLSSGQYSATGALSRCSLPCSGDVSLNSRCEAGTAVTSDAASVRHITPNFDSRSLLTQWTMIVRSEKKPAL